MDAALPNALILRLPQTLPENSETQKFIENNGYSRVMDKLSDALFHRIASKYSDIAADQLKRRIQRGIEEHFPALHTPTHPTYAMMIQRAIGELGEDEGSNEEAISDFIKREYEDLPLAHSTFLKRYLGKLCESGELVSSNGRYMISDGDVKVLKRKTKRGKGRRRVKTKGHKAKVDVGDVNGEKQPLEIGSQPHCEVKVLGVEWSEKKEMAIKESNVERLSTGRTGSELENTNSNDVVEENARNVEGGLGEKMKRALNKGSGLKEKEEFKAKKDSCENAQQSIKQFSEVETTITEAEKIKDEHPERRGQGRPRGQKTIHETKENFEQILSLKIRFRGRPPKPKLNPDQQSHGDNSPRSSAVRQGEKSIGRGRPHKTNQAIPALETLSASNVEQNLQSRNQVSCPSREMGDAILLQSKRPRRERRPRKFYEGDE